MKSLIILCLVIGYNASGQGKSNAYSVGYKLAIIEGHSSSESDMRVKRYNSLIRQLDAKYIEQSERIADMTVRARTILADNGVDVSHGNIMEGMNLIFAQQHDNMQYAEYVALYVTYRKKGLSHNQSIENITALLEALGIY